MRPATSPNPSRARSQRPTGGQYVGRKRLNAKHLPAHMQHRHGAYYYVRKGKWLRLAGDYGQALIKYAGIVGKPLAVVTIKDLVWHYIESAKGRLADKTLTGYRVSAANICAVFGPIALPDLEPSMVYEYLTRTGNVQANRDRALLSIAYTHARRIGAYRGDDPTKALAYRNEEKPRQRYVTDAEEVRLIATASPKLAVIIRFLHLTAMRQGDALRVRLCDLTEEGIEVTQGKTGHRQVITWTPDLSATVDEAKRLWRRFGREYLFESRGRANDKGRQPGAYTPSGLRALFRVARKKSGIVDIRMHDLRRKAGSDVTEEHARALLGHSDAKVTRKHYRAKADRVKPAK